MENPWTAALLGALGFCLGLVLLWVHFRALRLRRAMADTPTSKIRSAAMGKVEFKGLARQWQQALQAPFSGADCVWFRWKVQEERVHYEKGRRRTRWVEVASGESAQPFLLEDFTGQVKVSPAQAEIFAPQLLGYTSGGLWRSRRAPATQAAARYLASPSRVRLSEWRLGLGLPLYVLGFLRSVRLEGGGREAMVTAGRDRQDPFVISQKTEEELSRSRGWLAALSLAGSMVLVAGSLGWLAWRFGLDKLVLE